MRLLEKRLISSPEISGLPARFTMGETISSDRLRSIVLRGRKDALVLFSGEWCPDCRRFEPTWDEWTKGRAGPIYAVEVERDGPEWDAWDLDEIPTVAVYADGVELARVHGEVSAADLDLLWSKLSRG